MYYYWQVNDESKQIEHKTHPNLNEIVFAKITRFSGTNTYCELLEYNNLEGFISITELDKRVLDPEKQFKFETIYPLVVTAVNKRPTGICIDLSYKKVHKDTRQNLLTQFTYVGKLYTMLNEFCFNTRVPFELAQHSILFPLLEMQSQQYLTNAESQYKQYLKSPSEFFSNVDDSLEQHLLNFTTNMRSRLTITRMSVYQNFRLTIKDTNDSLHILKTILSYSHNNAKIEVIASPKYQLAISCENDEERQIILNDFLSYIEKQKEIYNFDFNLDELVLVHDQTFVLRPLNMSDNQT